MRETKSTRYIQEHYVIGMKAQASVQEMEKSKVRKRIVIWCFVGWFWNVFLCIKIKLWIIVQGESADFAVVHIVRIQRISYERKGEIHFTHDFISLNKFFLLFRHLLVRFASYALCECEHSYHRLGYVKSWNLFISCCNSRRFTSAQKRK